MKVKDIMTKKVVCAKPEMKISEVAKILFENRFHGMPVVEDGKMAGIVTQNDFFSKKDDFLFLPEYINFLKEAEFVGKVDDAEKEKINEIINARVKDIMTTECIAVEPEMEISELLGIIKKTRFNSVPVVNSDKEILGIVTLADLVELYRGNKSENFINAEHIYNREVDNLVVDVDSWWNRKYVLIKKMHIDKWKGALLLSFFVGALVFLIWFVSI